MLRVFQRWGKGEKGPWVKVTPGGMWSELTQEGIVLTSNFIGGLIIIRIQGI